VSAGGGFLYEEQTMAPVEFVTENLPLILGLIIFGLFVIGMALALRTEGGRERLAAAAVRLAVAALGVAEGWMQRQMEPAAAGLGAVKNARDELRFWLALRKRSA
jgi:hypothetical protein